MEAIGESQEHFARRASEKIALYIAYLIKEKGLTVESMRSANPHGRTSFSFDEMADFREALFHSERRVTSLMEELVATQNELEHSLGELNELRAAVKQMQNSVSWKLTKPLRTVRSRL
jgi:hypothetical protein